MSLRRAAISLLLPMVLGAPLGCAGTRAPAAPAPPPEPAPNPPRSRELESPVAPERAEELRRETAAALREADEILAGLDEGTRREHGGDVASVKSLLAQSRAALAEDDTVRAHNLARKALELARTL